ncbi:uncharacterized protein [Lepeophtheirus salmonis]|uniref:uncharacterized protein n=1 Tax=Lepeophtheirus salmonis TaxID=72036 RepID=UPI001AE8EBF1|nr:uncharacterized protein LOC121116562 [Lepeophtheirus salmonis]
MNKFFLLVLGATALFAVVCAKTVTLSDKFESDIDEVLAISLTREALQRGTDLEDCKKCIPSISKAIIRCLKLVPVAQISKCLREVMGAYSNCLDCICVILHMFGLPCE